MRKFGGFKMLNFAFVSCFELRIFGFKEFAQPGKISTDSRVVQIFWRVSMYICTTISQNVRTPRKFFLLLLLLLVLVLDWVSGLDYEDEDDDEDDIRLRLRRSVCISG